MVEAIVGQTVNGVLAEELHQVWEFSNGLFDMLGRESLIQLHASLDDVGNCKKDGMCAVVGYVAYSTLWSKFNWRWTMTLQQLNMPYLHTASYLNRFPLVGGDGITEEDICLILAPFIAAVRETLLDEGAQSICVITKCADYDALTPKEKKFIRPPEEHNFEVALALASYALRNQFNMSNSVAFQMDEAANAAKLYHTYESLKRGNAGMKESLSALCFCDDRKHPPVQAADMLGNAVLKMWRGWEGKGVVPRIYQQLMMDKNGKMPGSHIMFDLERLRRLAEVRMKQGKMLMPEAEVDVS